MFEMLNILDFFTAETNLFTFVICICYLCMFVTWSVPIKITTTLHQHKNRFGLVSRISEDIRIG